MTFGTFRLCGTCMQVRDYLIEHEQEKDTDPETDEGWNKETEITLMDMMDGENPDIRVMDQCVIADYVHSNKQRFLYVFDFFAERAFFMEICNIQNGTIPAPQIIKSEGDAPEQIMPDLMADNGEPDSDLLDVEDEADDFFKYEEGIDYLISAGNDIVPIES